MTLQPRTTRLDKPVPLRPSAEAAAAPQGTFGRLGDWLRHRILGAALSAASFVTLVSLIAPAWLDFLLDLAMIGIIAVVGKLARRK